MQFLKEVSTAGEGLVMNNNYQIILIRNSFSSSITLVLQIHFLLTHEFKHDFEVSSTNH